MKKIRKLFAIVLLIVCILLSSFGLTSCQGKEATYNAEYTFDKITFTKTKDLAFEDIAQFVPMSAIAVGKNPIDTIKEFEDYLRDNLDTYSIIQKNNGRNERIYLAPKYDSIFVKTDEIISVGIMKDGVLTYEEYTCTKKYYTNSTVYLTENEIFTFSDNTITYDFPFPLESSNSFVVVYNYKA